MDRRRARLYFRRGGEVTIEYVTRGLTFDNLYVEVTVQRWICKYCSWRETFHDTPPYGETVPTPQTRGWQIIYPDSDGEQECRCRKCSEQARSRTLPAPSSLAGDEPNG